MKNIFSIVLLLIFLSASAKFTINGTLKNYENQPVLIKIFRNGEPTLIQRVTTDKNGKFSYLIPLDYTGKIILDLKGRSLEFIVANETVSFETDYRDEAGVVNFTDSGINQALMQYEQFSQLSDLKNTYLPQLKALYQPSDAFYKAIDLEIKRIESLKGPDYQKYPALKYYIEVNDFISRANQGQSPANIFAESRKHLVQDDGKLENFGFIGPLVVQYISGSLTGVTSQEQANNKIKTSLDDLLDEVGPSTERGQAIISNIIPLLEANNFKDLSGYFTEKAKECGCSLNENLNYLIQAKENVVVGKTAPNIVFEKPVNGKKSLYDIKANKKLIVFWASWCPHCVQEMPFVKEFYNQFKAEGGEIIAVSLDMEEKDYKDVVGEMSWYNYSDLKKWDSPAAKLYGINATPSFFLLDKDNKILKTGDNITAFSGF